MQTSPKKEICKDDKTGVIVIKRGKKSLPYPDVEPELKLDERVCTRCGKIEEWKWLHDYGFSRYMISSLGRVLNASNGKMLKGSLVARGYRRFKLINDESVKAGKHLHTLIGYVFFNLQVGSKITMDHINQDKEDNRYCNLRPATKSTQVVNRTITAPRKGKKVYKIDMDDNIVVEYESLSHAGRELGVHATTVARWCKNKVEVKNHTFRLFVESDIEEEQIWKSTSELYPDIQPPLEVSDAGWIRRAYNSYTRGTPDGRYLLVGATYKNTERTINMSVHVLIWTVFHNMLVPKDLEISHINREGTDNHLSNLEAATHSKNMRNTTDQGLSKSCVKIRRHNHDGTHVDYASIAQAAELNNVDKYKLGKISLEGIKTLGLCKCGEEYTWTRLIIKENDIKQVSTQEDIIATSLKDIVTAGLTINKSHTKIRRHNHDGTHVDYTSIKQASELNRVSASRLGRASRKGTKTVGFCKCGEGFLWTRPTG